MKHPYSIDSTSVVATTGTFKILSNPRAWIQARGGTPVIWSPRVTHLLVGSEYNPAGWKYVQATANTAIQIIYESELPTPAKDLWVDRYRPQTLADVIGHAAIVKDLKMWLAKWSTAGSVPRAALLTGPPGIGKTTVAHLLAKEAGYAVTEYNASDERSAKAIREIFEKMAKLAALPTAAAAEANPTKRLLILDEVDGMSAGDRGGVAEIAKWIREGKCAFPIICLANDRTSPKLKGLATLCFDCRFARPQKATIAKALVTRLAKEEGIQLSVLEVEDMCERAGNDIRSLLNSLQFAQSPACASATGTKDESLRMDPFSATNRLFGTTATLAEREQAVFVDTGFVPLMVHEAYLSAAEKCRHGREAGLGAAVAAAESLSAWDIVDSRVHRQQAWGLMPAAAMAIVGAAKAAAGPPPFQLFPAWLGKQSKRGKHQRLLQDMRARMGIAGEPALMDTRNTLRAALFSPAATIPTICDRLAAVGATRDDMLETLVETVFKGGEADVAMETKKKSALTREWKKRHPEGAAAKGKSGVEKDKDSNDGVGDDDDTYDMDDAVTL